MTKPGRKSASSLAVATIAPLEKCERPDAPYDLSDEEVDEWRAVVNRMPADWFARETYPLLTQYCRHIVRARRIAQILHGMETGQDKEGEAVEFDLGGYNAMLRAQERESRAIAMLATKMRLSQQSTYDKSKKKGTMGKRPWDVE